MVERISRKFMAGIAAAAASSALSFASSAAAQETTYIDCATKSDQTGIQLDTITYAITGQTAKLWEAATGSWVSPCIKGMVIVSCKTYINQYRIAIVAEGVGRPGLSYSHTMTIDRTTGSITAFSTLGTRVDPIFSGKCMRGQDPATKPRAF